MTVEGPRLLDKALATALISNDAEAPPSTTSTLSGNNWVKLSNICFANRTYFDLSGYNLDDLTVFFQGVDIQEEFGTYGLLPGYVVDIISTEYLTDADIINAHISEATALDDLPGFPASTFDMEQVVYGRTRTYVTSTIWGGIGEFSQTQWGTCSATTADKLHITRIVYTDANTPPSQSMIIPPCNYVVAIVVDREATLPFLMRQKRSYELATGP
jgi:hypothetical protein